jgi:hypothetical protein
MAEWFRMVFLAKGRACRRGGARELVEDLPSELRRVVVMAMPADLLQAVKTRGEVGRLVGKPLDREGAGELQW